MEDCKPIATPMADFTFPTHGTKCSDDERKLYQRLIGCLLYIMHGIRPDLAYSIIRLSQYAAAPMQDHWLALKRLLWYLKGISTVTLCLGRHDDQPHPSELTGYFDAAHGDYTKRRSTGGYIFLRCGSPILWACKVQRTVAVSTTEAEYTAATESAKECLWICSVAPELGRMLPRLIKLYGDNQGTNSLTCNPELHQRTKHIDIGHRFITSLVTEGSVSVSYRKIPRWGPGSVTRPYLCIRS